MIAGVAVALKQAADPEFRTYICHVKENCVVLSETLKSFGYKIVTDGTDNHLLLLDLRPLGLTGSNTIFFPAKTPAFCPVEISTSIKFMILTDVLQ